MNRPVLQGLILAAMAGPPALADTVGDALGASGGSEFLVSAGDAIQNTCQDLASSSNSLTAVQADLFGRCATMVRTVVGPFSGGYGFETDAEIFDAIRQFSGEETSSQGRFATDNTNRSFGAVGARLDAIRLGARGASFALNGEPMMGGAASAEGEGDLGFAWFASANVGSGDRDQTENESEYDFDSVGGTVGLDYAFSSGLVVGLAVGYADYDVDYADDLPATVNSVTGGGIESDGYTGSLFGSYATERFYLNAIAGIGSNDYDMDRRAFFTPPIGLPIDRTFTAETESDQVSGQVTAGFSFGEGAVNHDLYVGVDYLSVEIDGYTETDNSGGGLALTFGDQEVDSTQSILGWAFRMNGNTGAGVLMPYTSVEWRHEFENDARSMDYRYANAITTDANVDGIVSPSFNTPTDSPDEDYFEVSIGLSGQFANNFLAFAQFDTSLGLSDTTASRVTIGVRGSF